MPEPADKGQAQKGAGDPRGETPPENDAEERRFDHETLQRDANARLGVSPHAVAGALATERRKTLTLEEAEKAVSSYLKREIEPDNESVSGEAA